MRLATVLTPPSDENLQLAAQCGVTEIVTRYPGPTLEDVARQQERFERFGLRLAAIEGYLPIERIKTGTDDGRELEAMQALVRQMGELGIPLLCYNFMSGTDWVRTRLDAPDRAGSRVTSFDLVDAERAVLLGRELATEAGLQVETDGLKTRPAHAATESSGADTPLLTADQLWANLTVFLREMIPIAEEAGVTMVMHPDDPPLPVFQGRARIMNCVESFERLVELVRSPSNGICFCQGTFAAMGVDIQATIRRLGPHIRYVHFRDVRGKPESFVETWHDAGPTDMVAAMRAYREVGFDGPIRPDHVPQLVGEDNGEPGYTMLGRLFAWGYIRALIQATETV